MALRLLLLCLCITLCLGDFGTLDYKQKVCLYSEASTKVLTPLQLYDTNCPTNKSYCMNTVYKYSNFQYNGVAALKPVAGEIVMFLSQDQAGRLDFVEFLNANVDTTMKVWTQITGADPTNILLYDDPAPSDTWLWNPATNSGNFSWTTRPSFTDGVIIGHINFVDNYCIRSTFTQPNNAIQKISIMAGNITNPQRILTVNYASGNIFEFCQYPRTGITHSDVTCPGRKDGTASIWIVFGPSNVQYKWFNEAGDQIGSTASMTKLAPGTYTIVVNDTSSNGCTAERTVTIAEPTIYPATVATTTFTCAAKGSATATPVGGSGGFTYQWFKSSGVSVGTGQSIGNLMPGSYYVVVTDSCGSTATTSFTITTIGCCGDGICQQNEQCGGGSFCASDCGQCCPPGTYVGLSGCVACPAGSRSTTYQSASCTSCPANTFNAGGTETCAPCPVNTYSSAGSGKCLRCPSGKVRGASDTMCHTCGDGSYADPCDDNAQCAQCAAGTYSANGASMCQSCLPGSFSAAGASSCDRCAPNTYSGAGASSCTGCPQGTTTIGGGATHILACN